MLDGEIAGPDDRPADTVKPEVQALSAYLKQLFGLLGTSLTRYAARCHRDKGAVSRYLNGVRVPPQDFVDGLLLHVAEINGQAVTAEVQRHAEHLRMEALRVSNAGAYELEVLRQRLSTAEEELHRARVLERVLLQQVAEQESRAAKAEHRYRELEDQWTVRISGADLVGCGHPTAAEEETVREELARLRAELERAQRLKQAAEQECVRLEAQLLAAEARLATHRSAAPTPAAELESRYVSLLREMSTRIGTSLDIEHAPAELCSLVRAGIADLVCVDLHATLVSENQLPQDWTANTQVRRLACAWQEHMDEWGRCLKAGELLDFPAGSPHGTELLKNQCVPVRRISPSVLGDCAGLLGDSATTAWFAGFSLLAVPLSLQGGLIGVLVLLRGPEREPFEESDAVNLQGLADLAAMAVDRARLYRQEFRAALALQRSLLPAEPPQLPGIEVAFRYLPNEDHAQVGGDWFDAVSLSGSRVALVIGDVLGHGLHSVAAMGRFRSAMQTLAALDLPPAEVLYQLDGLCRRLGDEHLTTCLYMVYDPVERRCTVANAGHLAPALVTPDGRVQPVVIPTGVPIGVGGIAFETVEFELPAGSVLAFFTDGLVTSRNRDLDIGLDMLHSTLSEAGSEPEAVADTLVKVLTAERSDDDVAVLVARLDGIPAQDVFFERLHPRREEVGWARSLVGRCLASWGLHELDDAARLLVSEATTAAITYAHTDVTLRLIRLDRRLVIEVAYDSLHLPTVEPPEELREAARHFTVISRLAERWGTARKGQGQVIWAELRLPESACR
jgi:serine phosphatase RsbU (regulator of sigma subunit)